MAFMKRRPRRRRRRHYGGNVMNALAPIGKGAALGLARVLGKESSESWETRSSGRSSLRRGLRCSKNDDETTP